ncbi:MAG: NTP transferase domain-containing protein [Azospirillum sp.]|nr:NTP transferase domain-containing protein [Azospirillum sp.]
MLLGKRFLAVIPARGGSKRVPRKNIRPLAGKPLLVWTLEQAQAVGELDRVVVSTDDDEIAGLTRAHGGEVVIRPAALANDTARTEEALLHALDHLRQTDGAIFDYIMVLEPTSPLRRPETIRQCMTTIVERQGTSLLTVLETRASLGRLDQGCFRRLDPGAPRRSQDRVPYYLESSTVYVATVDHLVATGSLVAAEWLAVAVDDAEGHDINSEFDFKLAEVLLRDRSTSADAR